MNIDERISELYERTIEEIDLDEVRYPARMDFIVGDIFVQEADTIEEFVKDADRYNSVYRSIKGLYFNRLPEEIDLAVQDLNEQDNDQELGEQWAKTVFDYFDRGGNTENVLLVFEADIPSGEGDLNRNYWGGPQGLESITGISNEIIDDQVSYLEEDEEGIYILGSLIEERGFLGDATREILERNPSASDELVKAYADKLSSLRSFSERS